MPLSYEKVKLEHIGRGGQKDDVPLVQEVEEGLASLAMLVLDARCVGKGKLSVTLTVEKAGEGAVLIGYQVKKTEPPMERKGLPAVVSQQDGELYAVAHRQEALDLQHVTPIRKAEETKEGGAR